MSGSMDAIDVDPYEQAKPLGVDVIESDDWQLQVDVDLPDGECAPADYDEKTLKAREQIVSDFCIGEPLETRSRNGNKHVYLTLNKAYDVRARIALQVLLGSDPIREMLALLRHEKCPARVPLVLFEVPEEAGRVRQFLSDRWRGRTESR